MSELVDRPCPTGRIVFVEYALNVILHCEGEYGENGACAVVGFADANPMHDFGFSRTQAAGFLGIAPLTGLCCSGNGLMRQLTQAVVQKQHKNYEAAVKGRIRQILSGEKHVGVFEISLLIAETVNQAESSAI
jgi:hypothetical protein